MRSSRLRSGSGVRWSRPLSVSLTGSSRVDTNRLGTGKLTRSHTTRRTSRPNRRIVPTGEPEVVDPRLWLLWPHMCVGVPSDRRPRHTSLLRSHALECLS